MISKQKSLNCRLLLEDKDIFVHSIFIENFHIWTLCKFIHHTPQILGSIYTNHYQRFLVSLILFRTNNISIFFLFIMLAELKLLIVGCAMIIWKVEFITLGQRYESILSYLSSRLNDWAGWPIYLWLASILQEWQVWIQSHKNSPKSQPGSIKQQTVIMVQCSLTWQISNVFSMAYWIGSIMQANVFFFPPYKRLFWFYLQNINLYADVNGKPVPATKTTKANQYQVSKICLSSHLYNTNTCLIELMLTLYQSTTNKINFKFYDF